MYSRNTFALAKLDGGSVTKHLSIGDTGSIWRQVEAEKYEKFENSRRAPTRFLLPKDKFDATETGTRPCQNPEFMESRSLTAIEAAVKIRSGKKWKKRYCVLQRFSPITSDIALLFVYKNVKCSLKSTRKKRTLRFEGFYGLESGFSLDKETYTLGVICQSCVVVLAFDSDYALRSWELWIRDLFGYSCQYSVLALELPPTFAALRNTALRLHLRDERFCLVHDTPPTLVLELAFKNLRRFGATPEKKFVIEAGRRADPCTGVYIFRSDCIDQMAWAFQMAREGKLNNFLTRRDDYENMTVVVNEQATVTSLSGSSTQYPMTTSVTQCSSSIDDRFAESFIPKSSNITSPMHCSVGPIVRNPRSKRDSAKNLRSEATRYGPEPSSAKSKGAVSPPDSGTIRHPTKVKTDMRSSKLQPPQATATNYATNVPANSESSYCGVIMRERPSSVCEPGCLSGKKQCEETPSCRPLSEIFANSGQNGADRIMLPLPMASSACSRCRNYVNQPFIDSLQYYYNIDHVVLALSKKSKCCDHVCANKKPIDEQTVQENNKVLLAAAAKINSGKVGDDSVPGPSTISCSVNVPSTDYAAMAPRGGLYVLMEPISPSRNGNATHRPLIDGSNAQRRHSQQSVPPDDPLHTDESNVVTVPSGEASDIAVAMSGIIVKPFEPLVLVDKRPATGKATPTCRRCVAVDREETNAPANFSLPSGSEKSYGERNFRGRRNVYGAPSRSRGGVYRKQRSEEPRSVSPVSAAVANVWRSASFAARDALRLSSRRTRTFFGALARRASSVVFGRGHENRSSFVDSSSDGRESRARSEPPITPTEGRRRQLVFPTEQGFLNDQQKWRKSVDLDDVIYEGMSPSLTSDQAGIPSYSGPKTKRKLGRTQRSLGTESTWSSDSNTYRSSRRSSQPPGTDVSTIVDSVSFMSEISDSDVFDEGSKTAMTTSEYVLPSEVSNRGVSTNFGGFPARNKIADIRPQKMDDYKRRNIKELTLAGSFSGYDGDGSSDSHAYSCTGISMRKDTKLSPVVVKRRIEKRTLTYSPPPQVDRSLSLVPPKIDNSTTKKPASKRHMRALAPPPPSVEGEIFKFPPFSVVVDDDSTLLNYATLAAQDDLTPLSAGPRTSGRRSSTYLSPVQAKPVEYAKIDELATQAARKAIYSRHDDSRTLSDGEHSIDTSRSVPCHHSSVKGRRAFALKKSLLRRRLSFASLSGV